MEDKDAKLELVHLSSFVVVDVDIDVDVVMCNRMRMNRNTWIILNPVCRVVLM